MKTLQPKARSRGLTLIEMLITLGIMAFLAFVAVPSLMDTLNRMAVSSAARTIGSALSLARSEAVKRGRNVSICPSTSGTDCAAGTWATGWIVFVDANGDANGAVGSVDSGDTIVRVYTALADLAVTTSPSTNLVSYDSKGFGKLSAVTTFKLCPEDGDSANAKSVEVSLSGRARVISSGVSCP